ncbi:MAG: hypothetical protein HY688_03790 [Chloroflexi bacterium]|nr:hypothetical protein [Chloroflexota bacterium]
MTEKRSLYECSHSRVRRPRIYCERGYPLSRKSPTGSLDIVRLAHGEPLEMNICRDCPDFDSMGPPLLAAERGWSNNGKGDK